FLGADVFASYLLPYGLEYSIKGSLLRAEDTNRESNLSMIPSNRLDNQIRYNLSGIELSESFLQIQYSTVFKQSRYNKEADFLEAPPTYSLLNVIGGTKRNIDSKSIGVNVSANNLLNVSYKEYMNRFRYYAHDL